MPIFHDDADGLAGRIIEEVGKEVVLGMPLGIGKANHVANALFRRAEADPSIDLKIFTALTPEKPAGGSLLERRFIGPVVDRLFADYPDLAYAQALRAGRLPPNVEVNEFFLLAGRWLSVAPAQQRHVSANYTHIVPYTLEQGFNVMCQLVAKRGQGENLRYSLSSNPDLTLDLLEARAQGRINFLLVGQVNSELPFMGGDAEVDPKEFAHVLDGPGTDFPLFAPPKQPVSDADYAVGLHVARLVPDGGTLQIGIGSMGDAVAQALQLRHRENELFREVTRRLARTGTTPPGHHEPFTQGLYGASEMFVDCFLDLAKAGVLAREVDGAVLHASFFLGPKAFYRALREMPETERARFRMKPVSYVNELYGAEEEKRRARVGARFVNRAMMVTLLGAVVSDGLEDGRVVSGVGGQYNLVAQAFALEGARSVIILPATRKSRGRQQSNIRWSYGHQTIPRHLRDLVVTEYGVADLRGRNDADVIAALLAVADTRFQDELLRQAKANGKIDRSFEIPGSARENTPERVRQALAPARDRGLLPPFPFGTDFTATEQRLLPALQLLKEAAASPQGLAHLLLRGLTASRPSSAEAECLARLGMRDRPSHFREAVHRTLLRGALRVCGAEKGEGPGE